MYRLPNEVFWDAAQVNYYAASTLLKHKEDVVYVIKCYSSREHGVTADCVKSEDLPRAYHGHPGVEKIPFEELSWSNLRLGFMNVSPPWTEKDQVVRVMRHPVRARKIGLAANNLCVRGTLNHFDYAIDTKLVMYNPEVRNLIFGKYDKKKGRRALSRHWMVDGKNYLYHFFLRESVGSLEKGLKRKFSFLQESFDKEVKNAAN